MASTKEKVEPQIEPDVERADATVEITREPTNDVPFSIYTHKQKIAIVLTASTAGFISPMTGAIYLPALNSVAADLHVSNTLINLTLTTYLIFQGLAPTFVGAFSDSAGRRPAYLICIVLWVAANIGIALQDNYTALLVLRCLQSSGSSGLIAIANAIVADIVPSAERGTYIAYASVGSILGPSLGPFIGGILSQYAGWRWIFWFLTIFGCVLFTPIFLFFPETCRKIVGNGSIPPPPLNHTLMTWLHEKKLKKEGRQDLFEERDRLAATRHITFPNPMLTLRIIFSKTACIALFAAGVLFSCYYAITSSIPTEFRAGYHLDDFQISLLYLPFGVGSLISAFTTGRFMDWNFRRHAKREGIEVIKNKQTDLSNFPIEKVRLEVYIPAVSIGAIGMLCYGWVVAERVSIAAPCVFLFLAGYSLTAGFNCMNILLVDLYPGKPATATAANNLVRCWMGAGAAAAVIPLINAIKFGPTVTLAAGIWISFTPILLILVKKGPRWRREAAAKEMEKVAADEVKDTEKAKRKEMKQAARDAKGKEEMLQSPVDEKDDEKEDEKEIAGIPKA
ncbi:MFS general substrate transporter [Microthyrium microscopicum]|uniref:MFS general substrate transporter n=1 Tax=Microthyrium microscopicum TaxID=703497 RepID=A0A6A6UJD1_9PEZI|nr:MFS general substrate transporter [Microthyrium microscopicum]